MRIYTNEKCKVCGGEIYEINKMFDVESAYRWDYPVPFLQYQTNYRATIICENGHEYDVEDFFYTYHKDDDSLEIVTRSIEHRDEYVAKIVS